jgi:hypothetical protein
VSGDAWLSLIIAAALTIAGFLIFKFRRPLYTKIVDKQRVTFGTSVDKLSGFSSPSSLIIPAVFAWILAAFNVISLIVELAAPS